MFLFTYIIFVHLWFVCIKGDDCYVPESSGVNNDVIHSQEQMTKSDPKNFTDHLQENLQEIRVNYETGKLPDCENIYYYLYTSRNPNMAFNVTNSSKLLQNSLFDYKNPLVIVIHGYQTELNLREGMIAALKNALLGRGNYNALFVDYTELNMAPFLEAIKKSFPVAKQLSDFLKFVKDEAGVSFQQMHIIGISLGGQIAGNTGHKLPGIGRITALDAAGDVFYSFPEDLKLDRSDAYFVDVIHTADDSPFPKGLGYYYPIGHLDFYPNGGMFQPGCESVPTNSSMSSELKEALHTVCMHLKSVKYYIESICEKRCLFVGVMCENYEKFEKGMCTELNSVTALMGQPATKPVINLPQNEMFFLETNSQYPFCKLYQP
ncbi:pancreatic triacylglycerol lipase-like [Parasteatoda tepidariorum]|uniref:pancreatic triacylglycerol lipase-like n=1 Tax=Parasteatoda tepidariorum TaxID=114398 RepID=UPI001C728DB0|nr:pancreatic triacylglycerol lipase-like isoform X1 [Parasteatoda tepidariorum]